MSRRDLSGVAATAAWVRSRPVLRVGKNAAARLATQVGARLLSMVLVALVARYETAAGLGRYVLVLSVVAVASAVSDLGLNVLLTREAARERDDERRRQLLGTVLSLKLILALAAGALLVLVAGFVPLPGVTRRLLALGCLVLLPEAVLGTARAFVNGLRRMEVSGAVDVGSRLLVVIAAFPVLAGGGGVAGVLICSAAGGVVGVAAYGLVLWRWGEFRHRRFERGLYQAWRACLGQSLPFALTAVIAIVYARLDLVMLALWQGDLASGRYAAAYKLWEAVGVLPASLLDALFPEMARLAGEVAGLGRLQRIFRAGGRGLLAGGLLLTAAGVLLAPALIVLVYGAGADYVPVVLPFRLLLCATPAMFLYLLSGHALYALGRQRRVTLAMLVVGVANLCLNVLLIPGLSALGTAIAALASEWLLFALLFPQARHALAAREVQGAP